MMSKSTSLSRALSSSGIFVSSLIARLTACRTTQDAKEPDNVMIRSLLKMLQLLHQWNPCPRQFVLDYNVYGIVKKYAALEDQVVVCQIANRLLSEVQISTMT
jgi:hypothetical protein